MARAMLVEEAMDRRLLLVVDEEDFLVGKRRYFSAVGIEADGAGEPEGASAYLRKLQPGGAHATIETLSGGRVN